MHGARIDAVEAYGNRRVLRYRVGERVGSEDADLVLLHAGVIPSVQASKSLGLEHAWSDAQYCWHPVTDAWGVSSNPNILVAGDGAGIAGAEEAARRGELAVLGLAARLGRISTGQRDARAAPLLAERRVHARLRAFLDALYAPPQWLLAPADDATVVCRCEGVSAGAIRRAVRLGADGPNQVKAFVRAGMGPCQGRMCAPTVAAVIAAERGVACAEVPTQHVRPPLKPLHLGDLADMARGADEDDGNAPSAAGLLHAPDASEEKLPPGASH